MYSDMTDMRLCVRKCLSTYSKYKKNNGKHVYMQNAEKSLDTLRICRICRSRLDTQWCILLCMNVLVYGVSYVINVEFLLI